MNRRNLPVDPISDIRGHAHCRLGRRDFVKGLAALAGTAGMYGYDVRPAAAEPPPEIQTIRLVKIPAICLAPEYVAEELFRSEGFSEVQYVEMETVYTHDMLLANRADFTVTSAPQLLPSIEDHEALLALAGLHGGCYELFANERVRRIGDLKGKRIAVGKVGRQSTEYFYLSSMLAYVGVDPKKDVEWLEGHTFDGPMDLFTAGKADAFLGFPPQPQQLRAKKVGRVIVNTAQDRPWSQYYCCLISARRDFVSKYPVATKRAVRAILKASDICAQDPERAAKYIVAKGYEPRYNIALEVLKSLSYGRWRTFDVDDSLRFFGVRLHESGMIKTDPAKLIAQGTDWRFLNELKRELKA